MTAAMVVLVLAAVIVVGLVAATIASEIPRPVVAGMADGQDLQERADAMRCDVCGRPGMVRHLVGGAASVTVRHRKSCPHHPDRQRRRR